jgi:hypothetical protein
LCELYGGGGGGGGGGGEEEEEEEEEEENLNANLFGQMTIVMSELEVA